MKRRAVILGTFFFLCGVVGRGVVGLLVSWRPWQHEKLQGATPPAMTAARLLKEKFPDWQGNSVFLGKNADPSLRERLEPILLERHRTREETELFQNAIGNWGKVVGWNYWIQPTVPGESTRVFVIPKVKGGGVFTFLEKIEESYDVSKDVPKRIALKVPHGVSFLVD